ncbi:MAG TPA: MaoC/PaaZ C-terminal domain-containing protein, partial [Dermatophilaceae bacterium]|nr:MaoC/PaaZ C-terminal domain-containing protein [Dermatophilaceae bacterium]
MAGLYFEDFEIGKEYVHPWSRTVTETDTILYCGLTMNPAPIHLDAHYMETTIHGQRLVPSL